MRTAKMSCRRITTEIETATRESLRNLPNPQKFLSSDPKILLLKLNILRGLRLLKNSK